jgi:hypothetical protein
MTVLEMVMAVTAIATAIFVGIGVLCAVKQLKVLVRSHADNHEWNRRLATQQALAAINTSARGEDIQAKFNYAARADPVPLPEILKAFEDDPSMRVKLNVLMNGYEALARGVFLAIYSETVVKSARKGAMIRTFAAFREYINHRRQSGSLRAWIEYERLVDAWLAEDKSQTQLPPTGSV